MPLRQSYGLSSPLRRFFFSGILTLALAGCEAAKRAPGINMLFEDQSAVASEDLSNDPTAEGGVPYTISISGLGRGETEDDTAENLRMRGILESAARIYRLQDKPPPNIALLRRRAASDVDLIERALRSEGYFEGEARVRVVTGQASKPNVRVTVRKGKRYALARQRIALNGSVDDETAAEVQEAASVNVSGPAQGRNVVNAEGEALSILRNSGWPYAERGKRRSEANFDNDTLDVVTQIDTGPETIFGAVTLEGLSSVEEDYLRKFIDWEEGQRISREDISKLQRALSSTRLFDAVSVNIPDAPPDNLSEGDIFTAPVAIAFEEAKHRSVEAGLSYSTSDGAGVTASWEHRNFFGRNERIFISTSISEEEQYFVFDGRIPRYKKPERDLIGNFEIFRDTTDAFDAYGVDAALSIEEKLSDKLSGNLGIELEAARNEENNIAANSYLFGLPGSLIYDDTDDELDPIEGYRASLKMSPWGGVYDGQSSAFLEAELEGSTYIPLDRKANYILAARARAGAVIAEDSDVVPPLHQLFSGGGGSVRAFRSQFVNTLDSSGDPIGGLSVLEGSLEMRLRFGSIGVVPFVDAGTVSNELFSDFGEIRWGGGAGLRYYSPIGPIRVDVAIPGNRRSTDDYYQLYLSIGQAF